ncbi:ATPase, AAA family [Spiroplasma corruscae]|uniref:ATPase, AAA family n=1 Tax=Spiroplasma corruscae TaxID=216934 RepID=A0A222EPK9_9MOLU|nr:ATP-binding protein [Spiroplasma corruscae]ASP28376.1 ATPase, AAA family [Spiroplasma corruscae]
MDKSVKDIIDLLATIKSDESIKKLKNYAKSLRADGRYNDAEYVLNILGSNKMITSSSNNMDQELLILEECVLNDQILNENNDYLQKFVNIIRDKTKLRNLGLIKAIFYGKPGTGKTTFVKDIAKLTNRNLYSISASSLISSLIGQTQKNMDLLFKDIIIRYKNSIFIIDEFDSVIGSRDENMNKEYHRMIGSFNLMLDKLLPETILFAITNRIDMIDSATLRRFNVKFYFSTIDIVVFKDSLIKKALEKKIDHKINLINKLITYKKDELNYAQIDEILTDSLFNGYNLEHSVYKILNFAEEDIINSKLFSDKDKSIILNKSYSTIRRIKDETNKI